MASSSAIQATAPTAQQDVVDSESEFTPLVHTPTTTDAEQDVIELASEISPPVQVLATDAEIDVIELDRDFTLFPKLPIELRVKVWEHAFPGRVVNLLYNQYKDRFHSFNTSAPKILHIHRESREMGLKVYHLCFGTESFDPRIYFDFKKDILLFDDYLQSYNPNPRPASDDNYYRETLDYADYPMKVEEEGQIQRIAVNHTSYKTAGFDRRDQRPAGTGLQEFARTLMTKFTALKEFSVVIETINPFSRGPIRFFNAGTDKCDPICAFCYTAREYQEPIERLQTVPGNMLKVKLVGGYRGSSRFDLGCYNNAVGYDDLDDKPDVHNPKYIADIYMLDYVCDPNRNYSYDSDDGETEKRLETYLRGDLFQQYEYEDVEMGFSDCGDDVHEALISDQELADIREDELLYQKKVGDDAYIEMQDDWVEAEYYTVRMTL